MKAYKIEMLVIDFDQLGERAIIETIETTRYPNHCISPSVRAIECRDIGLWDDNHPLNNKNKADAEYTRLFAPTAQPVALSDEELLGAVARGWCHVGHSHKIMDKELAQAIAIELRAILAAKEQEHGI